MQQAAFCGK